MNWPLSPSGYRYRALKEGISGWDVYALQQGLEDRGYELGADGVFGAATKTAVLRFQRDRKLTEDAVAGVVTQRELALQVLWPLQDRYDTTPGLARGQIEHESSYWLGNYSIWYEDSKSQDLGVCQINSHNATPEQAFDPAFALLRLTAQLRSKKSAYYGQPGARTHQRAWELAAFSWNAPTVADTLAQNMAVSAAWRKRSEAYIAFVTPYVNSWIP